MNAEHPVVSMVEEKPVEGVVSLLAGEALMSRVRHGLIGRNAAIDTPFGLRPLTYADYTASGRAVDFIEDSIRQRVLPLYANTHTEASLTGAISGAYRESARDTIKRCVNASDSDRVIFCGSGATGAIDRLIAVLGLRLPEALASNHGLQVTSSEINRPVVFVGPYEHHSNELPWRETIADVVRIGLDASGQIDQRELAAQLHTYRDRPLRIGSFSAASNVTGICSDVPAITALLKRAGALSFWDYAAAGPYVPIDMNGSQGAIDAVFVSPHKFIGGPGTVGLLIAKAALFTNPVPAVVGGGTVGYVSPTEHRYLEDIEHREEGGTPAIVESIRTGAVFALKDALGEDLIDSREQRHIQRALDRFADMPNVEVLGPVDVARLGIFSLRVHCGQRELHHGFMAALLNDLFGIQARGGCSCAGPYGHDLLGIDAAKSQALEDIVADGYECFKPGWVRINLHYVADDEEIDFILDAIELVAREGWQLLPEYRLDPARGLWVHRHHATVSGVSVDDLLSPAREIDRCDLSYSAIVAAAREILLSGADSRCVDTTRTESPIPRHLDSERWFLLAQDVVDA